MLYRAYMAETTHLKFHIVDDPPIWMSDQGTVVNLLRPATFHVPRLRLRKIESQVEKNMKWERGLYRGCINGSCNVGASWHT